MRCNLLNAVTLILLIFPLASLRPISEEDDAPEINAASIMQPRGNNPEANVQIDTQQLKLAADYLIDFGYLPDENITEYAIPNTPFLFEDQIPEEFISGLEWFQRQNGLKVTGRLDANTVEAMNLPRCGKHEQRMSYSLGAKWKKGTLTYKIINTTSLLPEKMVKEELVKALKVWENVSSLNFIEVGINQTADIDMFFVAGLHNDGTKNAFDGPGRVLGHAFMPPFGKSKRDIDGDLHLDNDEKWTINEKKGVNLLQAAAHEIGHSLGLDHSTIPGALMAPTYKGYNPKFQLHQDDIEAIQSLYGKPLTKVNQSLPSLQAEISSRANATSTISEKPNNQLPMKQSMANVCGEEPIDTFVSTKDGSIYLFKGEYFWELSHGKLPLIPKKRNPKLISSKWKELPSSIDAAIRMQNPTASQDGKIFFFKGKNYWKYENDQMEHGYPKLIKEGFPGVPNNIDAAFTQPAIIAKGGKVIREERIFFIKGKNVILYNPITGNSTSPQSLQDTWLGVKLPITAALSLKNEMFLIGKKTFQKILLLTYVQDHVFGNIHQAKSLGQLIACESTKP
ncbi:matrix metalloproteinase-18-like [Spea bombifrons]|uniref:matrix metalloproteinase-18-like n=1 Tax=Spea bombifrons TaxID=233779 RepID=UPI002349EC0B|nr:matrix metalloproteinase-18-like [Spea bombifrons]